MSRRVRAAIVGTGNIARAHVTAIQAMGDRAELVAAMEVDAGRREAFGAQHGIPRTYGDLDQMLAAERPDLVHVCTPPGVHADIVVRCLEAGAWVYCEKPLCASLAELDRIEAAEKPGGPYCSSVVQWRFGSGGQHVKRLIDEEAMGRLLVGVCNTVWYRPPSYYAVPWRGRWATELGGPTMGLGIHAMDFFLWLVGDWREVQAMAATLDRDIDVEDVSMALVRFERGTMATIVNSALSPRQESYVRLDFQRATVELSHLYRYSNASWKFSGTDYPSMVNTPLASGAEMAGWRAIPDEVPSSHGTQLTGLLDSMARGERPSVSGPEVRRTIEFLTALYKAAISGRRVRRGEITAQDPFYHHLYGPAERPLRELVAASGRL